MNYKIDKRLGIRKILRPTSCINHGGLFGKICFLSRIRFCKQADLPEPVMIELDGGFSITLFKDNITPEKLNKLGLNERQIKAVLILKEKEKISNKEYQESRNE